MSSVVLLVAQVPRLLFLPATLALLILGLPALNCSADTRADLFSLINQARIDAGLNPLTRDPQVDLLATEWAEVMAAKNIQKHRPLTKDLLNLHGWKNLSENIYGPVAGPVSAKTIFQAWMGSSGHRENLLRDSSTLGGVGIAQTKSGSICAVFNGAQPAPPPPATSGASSSQDSDVAFPGVGIPDFVPKSMRDPAAALPSNSDGRKLNQLGRTNL
ncbi:MAG: CAP domain-containing protein [Verrucomicrobia bacterium]|nr:CAP domain-containing protein [Verrucomicrobiota bacterium]